MSLKSLLLTLTFTLSRQRKKIKKKPVQQTRWLPLPIVNFPFISINILASPAYGVYSSQLIRYSIDWDQYIDFSGQRWDSNAKATHTRLRCKLKSSLQKFYGRHPNLVERYEILISQMTMDLLLFTFWVRFLHTSDDRFVFTSIVFWRAQVLFTFLGLFAHSGVQHILCFVFVLFFIVLCYQFFLDCPFLIAASVFSNIYLGWK